MDEFNPYNIYKAQRKAEKLRREAELIKNFNPYDNLTAQQKAEKLVQKVESGEVSDYGEAEELLELEEKEKKEKPEAVAWAKRVVKQWHDEIKPDYLFFTETGAIPFAYVLKSTWKNAYPNQETPRFYRLEPSAPGSSSREKQLQEFLSKRIAGNDPVIIVFDEGASGRIGTELIVEDEKYKMYKGISAGKVSLGNALEDGAYEVYFGLKNMLGHMPKVYASRDSGGSSIFSKHITSKPRDQQKTSWGKEISRSPTSRTFGWRSHRTLSKTEDEMLINGEYLKNLVENGEMLFRGRIVKHPAQRKRALAWIKQLKEIGREAGEELKKEIESKSTQSTT